MMHNQPYSLDKTVITERQFAGVLKETYSRLDGLESKLRESLAEATEKFANDPADAVQWRAESAVADQTTLSLLTEVRMLINQSEALEAVVENFGAFTSRYREQVVSWASFGENCSSAMTNIASRTTLSATAKVFGSWGLANEIERAIKSDIEETKKRVVVLEFVDLKVDEHFRLSPDTTTMMFRKLSPRKAAECVYPVTQANKRALNTREKVYVFRIPLDSDVIYEEASAAA